MPLDSWGADRYLHYFLAPGLDLLEQVETVQTTYFAFKEVWKASP